MNTPNRTFGQKLAGLLATVIGCLFFLLIVGLLSTLAGALVAGLLHDGFGSTDSTANMAGNLVSTFAFIVMCLGGNR
jgi:hypothetical protein